MAVFTENTIAGERQTRTLTGVEITMGITVSQIQGIAGYAVTDWAINSCGWSFGDSHRDYPECKLSRIDATAIASDTVELELVFVQNLSETIVNISTSLYQTETNKFVAKSAGEAAFQQLYGSDNLITVAYKYPDDYELDTDLQGSVIKKSPTVPKDSHDAIMTITREETLTYQQILDKITNYVNTLNTIGWSFDPYAPTGAYKCIDVNGQYNAQNGTYMMNYVFAYRPANFVQGTTQWDVDLYYRDERTGEPPSDVVAYASLSGDEPDPSPGGIRLGVPIYERKHFDGLITV